MNTTNKKTYSRREAAELLGVTSQTVTNWASRGILTMASTPGDRRQYFSAASVRALLKNNNFTALKLMEWNIEAYKTEMLRAEADHREAIGSLRRDTWLFSSHFHFLEFMQRLVQHFVSNERSKRFILASLSGTPLSQIAENEGISPEAVRIATHKAVERLTLNPSYIELREKYDALNQAYENLHLENFLLRERLSSKESRQQIYSNLFTRPLSSFHLSVRTSNALEKKNITTLGALVTQRRRNMLTVRNFGKRSLQELDSLLESLGLHFGMTEAEFLSL